ncbi:MAG: hypothetical protein ACI865_002670 [Flavobacteriaceae bacterium]|jgi:hypothetical protein
MKIIFTSITLLSLVIYSCSSTTTSSEGNNITTDNQAVTDYRATIINQLQTEYGEIDLNDVCIDSSYGIKNLFIVGFFAHDRGCGGARYFFKGKEITFDAKTTQLVLVNSGFKSKMLEITEAYHEEVLNHYEHDLSSEPERFIEGGETFFTPKVEKKGNQIISTMWIQERGGMLPEVSYHLSTFVISLDGTPIEHTTSNRFTVDY